MPPTHTLVPPVTPGRVITQTQVYDARTGLWSDIHDVLSHTLQGTPSADAAVILRSMVEDLVHTCIVLVNASPYDIEHREHCDIEEDGWQYASDCADNLEHWLQKDKARPRLMSSGE